MINERHEMIIEKTTRSLCPECLTEIPAVVQIDNQEVRIFKKCPTHGFTNALIEKDPIFYMLANMIDKGNIYNGLFIDSTNRCNAACKYCYHKIGDSEPSAESILQQCRENANLAPFVLVGGEPTMRDDLPELLRSMREIAPVLISTNGLKLASMDYLKQLDALEWDGLFNASISLHPESNNAPGEYEQKIKGIDNILATGRKLFGLIFVIDSLDQIDEAISVNRKYKGKICATRIKIASQVNQTGKGSELFNSDVYNHMALKAQAEGVLFDINYDDFNKPVYFNIVYDGMNFTTVKWYSKFNVDLNEINCAPWHKNKNGRFLNMGHSLILGG